MKTSDLPGSKLTRSTPTKLVDLLRHSDRIETRSELLDQLKQTVPQVDEGEEKEFGKLVMAVLMFFEECLDSGKSWRVRLVAPILDLRIEEIAEQQPEFSDDVRCHHLWPA